MGIPSIPSISSIPSIAGGRLAARAFLRTLSPTGYWRLGEASGDALDYSGNGNDGTVTLGAGARGVVGLDRAGDGALTFDGAGAAGTIVQMSDVAGLQDIFSGGGAFWCLVKPTGVGGTSAGALADKNTGTWSLRCVTSTGTACSLQFIKPFTGSIGTWVTSSAVLTYGRRYAVGLWYDCGATTNDPVLVIVDLDSNALTRLTVGDGLTESVAPVGTFNFDAGGGLCLGNRANRQRTLDGTLDEAAVWKGTQPTEAQFQRYAALAA